METKLSKYTYKEFDLEIAPDLEEEFLKIYGMDTLPDENDFDPITTLFLYNIYDRYPKYEQYIKKYGEVNKLERITMLFAHGNVSRAGNLVFSDTYNLYQIQNWVNERDGKYNLIILQTCNPEGAKITSQKSLILIPNSILSGLNLFSGDVQIELYVPQIGYLSNYTIEYELKQLG
jgi:hypothetical protein